MIFATARRPDFTPEICEPWMRQARQATHFVAFFGAWTPPNCGGRKFWFDHVIRNHGIQSRNLGCNSFQRQVLKIIGFPNEITKKSYNFSCTPGFPGPFWVHMGNPWKSYTWRIPNMNLPAPPVAFCPPSTAWNSHPDRPVTPVLGGTEDGRPQVAPLANQWKDLKLWP